MHGFTVLADGWDFDFEKKKAILYYSLGKEILPELMEQEGPPLNEETGVKGFREKHENTKIRSSRIYAIVKRKFRKPEDLIRALIKDEYVTGRVREIKVGGIFG